jgi:IS5 family transposase
VGCQGIYTTPGDVSDLHLHQSRPWIHPSICCHSLSNIHDSQILPRLLDLDKEHDSVWADSAYSGECFEDLLSLGGFESLTHEKVARNHPLSDAVKELNRVKSSIRVCMEHVFGCMTMSMGGTLTRRIWLERNEAWWGLKNLAFNFLRYLQRSCNIAVAA